LLVVDRTGIVEGVWEGKVSPHVEEDILDVVASSGAIAALR
jgi:hypothetical protein